MASIFSLLSLRPAAAFVSFPPPPPFGNQIDIDSKSCGGRLSGSPPRIWVGLASNVPPEARVRTGGVSVRVRRRRRRDLQDGDPPEDAPLDALDAVARLLSTPVPLPIPGPVLVSAASATIPLAYPLALVVAAAIFPTVTVAALTVSFASFLALGRAILAEDDENGGSEGEDEEERYAVSDLVAFVGAVAAAGLLSPQGFVGDGPDVASTSGGAGGVSSWTLPLGVGTILAIGLAGLTRDAWKGGGEGGEANRRLMDMWDERLDKEEKKNRR